MAYEKVEIGTWKPEKEDDFVEGVLISKESDVGVNKSMLYHLEQKDNKPMAVWGSTVLDTKMSVINVGEQIKIVYLGLGKAQKGQNAPKLFDVYRDRDAREDPSPTEELTEYS